VQRQDRAREPFRERGADPRSRLVHQDQYRVEPQDLREFDQLALPVAELGGAGVGVGSQTELIQDSDRAGTFGGSHPACHSRTKDKVGQRGLARTVGGRSAR